MSLYFEELWRKNVETTYSNSEQCRGRRIECGRKPQALDIKNDLWKKNDVRLETQLTSKEDKREVSYLGSRKRSKTQGPYSVIKPQTWFAYLNYKTSVYMLLYAHFFLKKNVSCNYLRRPASLYAP